MLPEVLSQLCTGCGACEQICVKKCITMVENNEGFLYPEVDEKSCSNCGLCGRICPVINMNCDGDEVDSAYAAYCKDYNIREISSSGGVFTLLAQYVLRQNGIVFGAEFDAEFGVCHSYVENENQLYKLQGSKYTQSVTGNSYKQVKCFLKDNRTVLFTGTPCQIAGLKGYLGKTYDNLITVDILCHGVPSPKVWKAYLSYLEDRSKSKVYQVSFRNKSTGWKNYSVKVVFQKGREYISASSNNEFMQLFLHNICLRNSCYNCKFKALNRPSDITIGDCWGIEKYLPEMDDDKGTSVVLIHSLKGNDVFEKIKDKLIFKQGDVKQLTTGAKDSLNSVAKHPKRDKFFKKFNSGCHIKELTNLIKPSLKSRLKYKINKLFK